MSRPERPPFEDGAADQADAGRQEIAGLEVLQPLAGDGDARERAVGLQQSHYRGLRGEQRQDALGDAFGHLGDVEGLGEPAGHAGQFVGVTAQLLALVLGPLEIGDVGDVGHETANTAVLARVGYVGGPDEARPAVAVDQLALEGDLATGQHAADVMGDGRVRRVAEDLAHGAAPVLLRGPPEPVPVRQIVEEIPFIGIDVADQRRHRLDDELQSRAAVHRARTAA